MFAFALAPVVLVLIGYLLLREDRNENGGQFFWQRSALLATGARATGVVLDQALHHPGWRGRKKVHTVDLVIEFTPGQEAIRIPLRYRLIDGATTELTDKGRTVPLRYDPRVPKRALIDWPEIYGGPPREATSEEREADAARQAALLRGDGR